MNNLKLLRTERQLSQRDLAEAAGISIKQYRRYEQGAIPPPLDKACALADALGCTLDLLAGRRQAP